MQNFTNILNCANNSLIGVGTLGQFSGGTQIGSGANQGLYGDGTNIGVRAFNSAASDIYFQTFGGLATNMIIKNNGNVGIGLTNPTNGRLEVSGNIAGSGYATRSGTTGSFGGNVFNIFWTGTNAALWIDNVNAGNIQVSSDGRIKKDIEKLPGAGALAAVNALNPVTFDWIDPANGIAKQYGFIAQQVREVLPDLVNNTGIVSAATPDGLLHLDYNGLFAPIVGAIQELDARTRDMVGRHAGAHAFGPFEPPQDDGVSIPAVTSVVQRQQAQIDELAAALRTLQAANEQLQNELDKLHDEAGAGKMQHAAR